MRLAQRTRTQTTDRPEPDVLIQDLFLEQVKKRPDHLAIITPSANYTYREIYTRSNQLGHVLRGLGVRPNTLVAVVMDKGWEQVVGVLGILMAGGAYLPISPNHVENGLWYLPENEKVTLALTQSWLMENLEWPASIPCIPVDMYELNEALAVPLNQVQKSEDLACMIYSPETAGTPGGMSIDHHGAVNTIIDINRLMGIHHLDRVFVMSSLSCDVSVYDIFGTLAVGGTIVLPEPDGLQEPSHWENLINQEQVTVWSSAPAVLSRLVEFVRERGRSLPAQLRHVLLNGDGIPVQLPEQIKSLAENAQITVLGEAEEQAYF